MPRVPRTGRWRTGKITPSPCASGTTSAQALSQAQIQQVWSDLGLLDPSASQKQTLASFNAQVDAQYLQYWQLVANGTVLNGVLTLYSQAIPLFKNQAAAELGKNALAARAFLRAGTLAASSGRQRDALKLLGRAYGLAPQERSVALLYAEAKLRNGDAAEAAALLEPFAPTENDISFLETFADALQQAGQLDRARTILERLLREKNEGVTRLFGLADAFADAGQDATPCRSGSALMCHRVSP